LSDSEEDKGVTTIKILVIRNSSEGLRKIKALSGKEVFRRSSNQEPPKYKFKALPLEQSVPSEDEYLKPNRAAFAC